MPEPARRQARIDAGLCVTCGSSPPADGRLSCEPCLAAHRAREAERRAQHRRAGTCLDCCEAPALPGQTRCEPCRAKQAARMLRAPATAAR
jgi:hypothetical protein